MQPVTYPTNLPAFSTNNQRSSNISVGKSQLPSANNFGPISPTNVPISGTQRLNTPPSPSKVGLITPPSPTVRLRALVVPFMLIAVQ